MLELAIILQLFILLDPFISFPVLLSAHRLKMDVPKIALHAIIIAFVVAIAILLAGPTIFRLFGISIDSFRLAGGVVLFLLGLEIVRPKAEPRASKEVNKIDSLTSIIATPLLTGPAVISFIIIQIYSIGQFALASDIIVTFLGVGIVFMLFAYSVKYVNPKIVDIVSKIFGLFLTAIAIQMMATGISGLFSITPVVH